MRLDTHIIPLEEIKTAIKTEQDRPTPRYHLGASQIGAECRADLWHSFHWSVKAEFDANTHLRFLDGHRSEDVMAEYIRKAGYRLSAVDVDGSQYSFKAFGGHFAGSLDGIIRGGMPWHKKASESTIWEHKACNEKKWKDLERLGVKCNQEALEKWDEVYFAQAQIYMHMRGIKTHWLTCSTPGCRDFTAILTHYNKGYAQAMMAKAEILIGSANVPPKAYKTGDYYKAKFLSSYDLLYRGAIPEPNFRNSLFSFPIMDPDREDAAWFDDYVGREMTQYDQNQRPPHHLWMPTFIHYAECVGVEDNTDKPRWAVYKLPCGHVFYNCQFGMEGDNAFNSEEMRWLDAESIKDPTLRQLRRMGATIEAGK